MGISFAAAFVYYVRLGGARRLKTFFFRLLPLWLFVVVINSLFSGYGVSTLFVFPNGARVSLESTVYGATAATLTLTVLLWFACWNEVVTRDKFTDVLGGLAPKTALLTVMTLRFVPLYAKRLEETLSARRAAGLTNGKGKIDRLKDARAALLGATIRFLEMGIDTADYMKARGYGLKGKTNGSGRGFSPADAVLTALESTGAAISLACKLSGRAEAAYNPVIEISGASPVLVFSAAVYAAFCFLPVIYDLAEDVRWRRLYAKI